jgi:DNA-binding transcriptional LysR family regulator
LKIGVLPVLFPGIAPAIAQTRICAETARVRQHNFRGTLHGPLCDHPSDRQLEVSANRSPCVIEPVCGMAKRKLENGEQRLAGESRRTISFSVTNSGPVGDLLSHAVRTHEIELQDRISVRTFYVAAALVRAGAGFAVIDEFTARAVSDDDFAFCPLDPPLAFDVRCIFLADRPPSRLGKAFIDAMSAALRQNAAR